MGFLARGIKIAVRSGGKAAAADSETSAWDLREKAPYSLTTMFINFPGT